MSRPVCTMRFRQWKKFKYADKSTALTASVKLHSIFWCIPAVWLFILLTLPAKDFIEATKKTNPLSYFGQQCFLKRSLKILLAFSNEYGFPYREGLCFYMAKVIQNHLLDEFNELFDPFDDIIPFGGAGSIGSLENKTNKKKNQPFINRNKSIF